MTTWETKFYRIRCPICQAVGRDNYIQLERCNSKPGKKPSLYGWCPYDTFRFFINEEILEKILEKIADHKQDWIKLEKKKYRFED